MSTPTENTQTLAPIQAIPEGTRAITKYTAEHGREIGLPSPEAVNYMMSVASLLTHSALITPDMGVNPEQVKANAMAKMLVAHEMGIPALQGLQEIDIVKGRIFVRYPQLIAQMMKRGFVLKWVERSDTRAALDVTPPKGAFMLPETFEFTFEDAKKAGLTGPTRSGEPSQYMKRPRVMLSARVVSEAFRMTGGLAGVYTPEERDEISPGERGDNSNAAFQEQAEKNRQAENPFGLADPPTPTVTKEPKLEKPAPASEPLPERKPRSPRRSAAEEKPEPDSAQTPTGATPSPNVVAEARTVAEASRNDQSSVSADASVPFKAGDDSLPEILRTPVIVMPAPVTSTSTPTQDDRFKAVFTKLKALNTRDNKAIQKEIQAFVMAFGNIHGWLKVPQAIYDEPLDFLEACLPNFSSQIVQDGHTVGLGSGTGWMDVKKFMDGWSPESRDLVKRACLLRYPQNPDIVLDFISTVEAEGKLPFADFRVLMKLLLRVPDPVVMKFRAAAHEKLLTFERFSAGLDLDTASEGDILTLIGSGPTKLAGEPSTEQPDLWEE